MNSRRCGTLFLTLFLVLSFTLGLWAQAPSGALRGQVADQTGAVVPNAEVTVTSASGQTVTALTTRQGQYEIKGLAPGTYTVTAAARGFATFAQTDVAIAAGQAQKLDIALEIEVLKEQVQVQDEVTNVDVSSSNNASTLVLKGKDLDALSDDPDELEADLQALAGPAAGPNGGQIYIDGFSGGQLPPKAAIREIRINQNPFSAQYDRPGHGRIEVFTRPGMDKYHGQMSFMVNNSVLNTRNPFVKQEPGYQSEQYSGNFSGPLNKKSSFFFNFERRNINENSIINALVLDPTTLAQTSFSEAILNPRVRTSFSPRLDYQITTNNNFSIRYQINRSEENNAGIGQFSLPSQAYDTSNSGQSVQISDTQVLSSTTINETRFQYNRSRNRQAPQSSLLLPTIQVMSAFTGGGSSSGNSASNNDRYELQNYTSMSRGKHIIKFGARLRVARDASQSTRNFNGLFIFTSLDTYRAGIPSQFTITTGQPLVAVTQADVGFYAEDDFRIRPNFTLSYGMRFETQNNINDHADFAPRIGIAWGLGRGKSTPKTVLRAGFGVFYDRFGQELVMQAERLNGATEKQYVVASPTFYPTVPDPSTLVGATTSNTIYQINSKLRSPYMLQSALALERQLTKTATLAVTYLHTRGVHQLLSRNVNAPLPDTFDPAVPGSGVRPLGTTQIINEYESAGVFKQDQVIANVNYRGGARFSLNGFYALNFANSNTSGAGSFPVNQYNLAADYGRAGGMFGPRHRAFFGGSISLPYSVRMSPFVTISSGAPFNISLGQDLNGDSIFNDRPSFATNLTLPDCGTGIRAGCVKHTPWGVFQLPTAGQAIIPPNYGTATSQFSFNMRVAKTFGFGKVAGETAQGPRGGMGGPGMGGGGDHGPGGGGMRGGFGGMGGGGRGGPVGNVAAKRYSLTFSASARNLFNIVNLASPQGNLNSPLFGTSTAIAGGGFGPSSSANRRIELQVQFGF
jgi:Carboxypeptidase regulatory-like domain